MTVDWTKLLCFIWFRHSPRGCSGAEQAMLFIKFDRGMGTALTLVITISRSDSVDVLNVEQTSASHGLARARAASI